MNNSLFDKVHLNMEEAYIQSQKAGKAGSWLYICDSDEYVWSEETYELYGIGGETCLTRELYFQLIIEEDRETARAAFKTVFENKSYCSVHRMWIKGQIKWIEDRGSLYQDKESGLTYVIGMMHEVTWIKEQERKNKEKQFEFEVITNYLAETTNATELYSIVANAHNTIKKVMDVVLIGIFVHLEQVFTRVIPDGFFDHKVFMNQEESDYIAYDTMKSGEFREIAIEHYPNEESRKVLMQLGTKAIACMPIRNDGEIIGALSVVLKKESFNENEREFCNTICGYLSTQLKNALLYRELERELEEKNRAEERNIQLQRSIELEKLRMEFFANLSHEFKTPINIILSSLELMKMKLEREDSLVSAKKDYDKLCIYMEQNAYRLLHLTTNLIDSTKLDNNFMETNLQKYNIVSILSNLIKSTEAYAMQRGIKLKFISKLQESPYLICDGNMVERIILNLLSNGIKNTREGGKIEVEIWEIEDYITISVSDTGSGIEKKMLPYIFEKFYVANNGLSKPNEGSGLGLSIVKALVELHEGSIKVDSKMGAGTTFKFTLSKNLRTGIAEELSERQREDMSNVRIKMEYAQMN